MSTTPTDDGTASLSKPDYEALTAQRLKACSNLLKAVATWLRDVSPSRRSPWQVQRQTELILRAILPKPPVS